MAPSGSGAGWPILRMSIVYRFWIFCHGVDHLAKLCKQLYGQGTEQFDKQLQQWRARLRKAGAAIIDDLTQLCATNRDHGEDIQAAINYFAANRERMDYPPLPRAALANRQRHRRKRLQGRRREDEGQRDDLDLGTGAAHATATRVDYEFALYPRPPALTTRTCRSCRTTGGRMNACATKYGRTLSGSSGCHQHGTCSSIRT